MLKSAPNAFFSFITESVAKQSLTWEGDKFYFIWNTDLTVGHFEEDSETYHLVSYLEPCEKERVISWINKSLLRGDFFGE